MKTGKYERNTARKKGRGGVLAVVIVLCVAVLVYAGYQLVQILSEDARSSQEMSSFQQFTIDTDEAAQQSGSQATDGGIGFQVDFAGLRSQNQDVVGWIRLEGTVLDYPVVQGEDNAYYLDHTVLGEENRAGSIFLDYRNDSAMADANTVIYGHRMNNGSMFAELLNYAEQEYYEAHPTLYLATPEQDYRLEVAIAGEAEGDLDFVTQAWASEEDFEEALGELENISAIDTDVSLEYGDKLVTLFTCVRGDAAKRFIVVCKLTPVG